jgi:hypothetical protein
LRLPSRKSDKVVVIIAVADPHLAVIDLKDPIDEAAEKVPVMADQDDRTVYKTGNWLPARGIFGLDHVPNTIRIDIYVVTFFIDASNSCCYVKLIKATGKGWQTRMNEALREWLKEHPMNQV